MKSKISKSIWFFSLIWILGISFGVASLYQFEFTPGTKANLLNHWPKETSLTKSSQQYQLVMFLHPQCPCSRASMNELALLMEKTGERLHASILFIKPELFDEAWAKSDLWYRSEAIPNVIPVVDHEGREASYFGATTSGHVFLYDLDGNLIFNGGITASRGHEGENIGCETILSYVLNGTSECQSTPYFGCPLFSQK